MEHGHGNTCGCHHRHMKHDNHGDGCCHGQGHEHGRHFFTREEKIKHLEQYLENLKAEAAGVEEELSALKN